MGIKTNVLTGIVSLIGYAPLVIFIGGLAKVTDVVNGEWPTYAKQVAYMLEWYLISASILYFLLVAVLAFSGQLKRCGTFLIGWLMCSAALLIYSATKYLIVIEGVDTRGTYTDPNTGESFGKGSLNYLRAVVAGEIATAAWSFFLTILINLGITADLVSAAQKAVPPTAA